MLTYRLQTPYILGAQKKSLLRRFSSTHNICGHMFWVKTIKVYYTDFWCFNEKSFTVVSSIIMKEDSYSEPTIRRVEMPYLITFESSKMDIYLDDIPLK